MCAMAARNRARAKRRIAERTRRNAAAVAAGGTAAADPPKRRYTRTKSTLGALLTRRSITPYQQEAGNRLYRDAHLAVNFGWPG
jgi:hypothetical protein